MEKITETTYEIAIGSLQAQGKRLFILCVILIVALIGTNGAWIWHEAQYVDSVTETVEATSDSGDVYGTITGDNSEVRYGITGESNTDKDTE